MSLKQAIAELKKHEFQSDERIFTMYLDTQAGSKQQQAWKLHFKNGMKKLKEYTEAEGNKENIKQFHQMYKQVEETLENNRTSFKNGLILVKGSEKENLFFEIVQAPVPNAFYCSEEPHLDELEVLVESYPSTGMINIGSEKVTVLDTFMGEIWNEAEYVW